MSDCLFCKIINREIPASIVYEDERVLAFNDIDPQGPTHVLVVPKIHIATLNDLQPGNDAIVGEMMRRLGDAKILFGDSPLGSARQQHLFVHHGLGVTCSS